MCSRVNCESRNMAQPLLFDERVRSKLAASLHHSERRRVVVATAKRLPTGSLPDMPMRLTVPDEIQLRRTLKADEVASTLCIRPRMGLSVIGFIVGVFISSGLIVFIAAGLAFWEVRWTVSAHYSVVAVVVLFGSVGALMVWSFVRGSPYHEHLVARIEATVGAQPQARDAAWLSVLENNPAIPTPGQALSRQTWRKKSVPENGLFPLNHYASAGFH